MRAVLDLLAPGDTFSNEELVRMAERPVLPSPGRLREDDDDTDFEQELIEQRRLALGKAQRWMNRIHRWASRLLAEAEKEAIEEPLYAERAFWTLIHYQAAEKAGLAEDPRQGPPLSPLERSRIGGRVIPLGPCSGEKVRDAPRPHLRFLAAYRDEFSRLQEDIALYLESTQESRS